MDDNNRENNGLDLEVPFASRVETVLIGALGCLNIVILALLVRFTEVEEIILAFSAVFVYLAEIAVLGFFRVRRAKVSPSKSINEFLGEEGSVVFKNSISPIAIFDSFGTVLWYNDAMRDRLGTGESFIDRNISDIFLLTPDEVRAGRRTVTVGGYIYEVEGFVISEKGNGIYLALFNDITRLTKTEEKYQNERVCVAYIAIDNVEDVLEYVQEQFADRVADVDSKLKSWAASINGVIKSYEKDKYVMLFDSYYLDRCVEDRFDILDRIRETRVGDGFSITVSMGISRVGDTLYDRECDAKDAIDMALSRGGDQVVYKSADGIAYYGGKTKSVYKKANIRSRTFANQLLALIGRADNVLIMGHRYGDFDSFGASIGIARIASLCGVKANIAVDLRDRNLRPCIELLQKVDLFEQTFVDNAEGLDLLGPDTFVVLVDHSAVGRAQFSDIAMKAGKIAVVDHHRKTEALSDKVVLSYIEPSASSASEIVAEMLECTVSSRNLSKYEADLLLAGILLDTKQFTRNTGTRTFGAAQYLRGAGADPTDVYNLFKTSPEELSKEARFHTSIVVYRDNIALSSCDGETDESFRIIASKAADKMLTLRDVDAAFALVKIGGQIHISGRSSGTVNVQLILERLGGGGHFDVAGAQVQSESILKVLDELKGSIDKYLDEK